MTSRRPYCVMALALLTAPALAGCDFETEHEPLAERPASEFCERPQALLADIWHMSAPVVGSVSRPDDEKDDPIGAGVGCYFYEANASDSGSIASSFIRWNTTGLGDPPDDARSIAVGEHTVKTWNTHSNTTVDFEVAIGGWNASITITAGAELSTGEPDATENQKMVTARELVTILEEFKGPDREAKHY